MTKQPLEKRVLTFDLLRGYLLLVILIDHIYKFPGFFEFFTGRGELWVSAAEGFFLISGTMVGLTNFPYQKLWRRSVQLYLWSISLTLLYTSVAHFTKDVLPTKPGLLEHIPIGSVVWQTMTLRYSYGWADFLNYYAVFLLGAPFFLFLLKRNMTWLVLLISLSIWFLRNHNFYLAWQILFVIGIIVGYYFKTWEKQIYSWSRILKIATYILLSSTIIVSSFAMSYYPNTPWFDKMSLAPGRLLLALIWFTAFILWVRSHEHTIAKYLGWLLIPIGQHSLFVYIFQSALVYAYFVIFSFHATPTINFLITISGISMMWLVTVWYKTFLKKRDPKNGI